MRTHEVSLSRGTFFHPNCSLWVLLLLLPLKKKKREKTEWLTAARSALEMTFNFQEDKFHGGLANIGIESGSTFAMISGQHKRDVVPLEKGKDRK